MMRTAPATSTDDTDIAVMYGAWSQSMTTASICVPGTIVRAPRG